MRLITCTICTLVFVASIIFSAAANSDSLSLSVLSGDAPLSVEVTGPELVVDKGEGQPRVWHGCGFSIDWGDGSRLGPNCADRLHHTYAVPGSYQVKARLWYPGPTDAPITTWKGTAEVEVLGRAPKLSIELDFPLGGETFLYQHMPEIKWDLVSDKKNDLFIELVAEDGTIVASKTIEGVAYTGKGASRISPNSYDSYIAKIASGNTNFFARISVPGTEVSSQSRLFTMNGIYQRYKGNGPSHMAGTAPLSVVFEQLVSQEVCLSYRMDWGDDTGAILVRGPKEDCRGRVPASRKLSFEHTYDKPGTYEITWKSNDHYGFQALEECKNSPRKYTIHVGSAH